MLIDSLHSLRCIRIDLYSLEQLSLRNLKSLKKLDLSIIEEINESEMSSRIFEDVSYINVLYLNGTFSNLNLDRLDNLERLHLCGKININDFNLNLSANLHHLSIRLLNIGNEQITKLFDGHKFPYLETLEIIDNPFNKTESNKITKLERKMFEGFPKLKLLNISYNQELRIIDYDAFSSLTNLVDLQLIGNSIEKIDNRTFLALSKLESLNLSDNIIESLEETMFSNLKNLIKLELNGNPLTQLNPQSFFGLGNLKELDLAYNKLNVFELFILDNIDKIEKICNVSKRKFFSKAFLFSLKAFKYFFNRFFYFILFMS